MNNWEIKKFLYLVLAIQLAVLGLVGLVALGFDIPVLRQLVGFIYLTFIPGLLILRMLRIHNLGTAETLLYSTGLSLAFLMLVGLLMNSLYPLMGLSGPISVLPLTITITVIILMLCFVAYWRDRGFSNPARLDIKQMLSPPVLLLGLLPILSILGTFLFNSYGSNALLLVLFVLISVVVALIGFGKFVPPRLYPLAIVMIAIAILFHRSLLSSYLVGWDIQIEYYLSNLVNVNHWWDPAVSYSANSCLSIVMLPTIYSHLMAMDLVWTFKVIYSLFFSLVPLGLYLAFEKQTDSKVAFLAAFFFMSMYAFWTDMTALARQQIAELFLVLLILLILDRGLDPIKRAVLAITFAFSLVVSHYALTYMFMFYLVFVWGLLSLAKVLGRGSEARAGSSDTRGGESEIRSSSSSSMLSGNLVMLFTIATLGWYMLVASSTPFYQIIYFATHIYTSLNELFVWGARVSGVLLAIGLGGPTALCWHRESFRILQYITQFFIVVGVIKALVKYRQTRFTPEYFAMVLASCTILLASIIIPYFSRGLNISRIYHVVLLLLSPFCILGGKAIIEWVARFFRASSAPSYARLLLIVLIPYFLLNIGFIYTITGDTPSSISLSKDLDFARYSPAEVQGIEWLAAMRDNNMPIYVDQYSAVLWGSKYAEGGNMSDFPGDFREMSDDTYIYLRSWNIEKGEIFIISELQAQLKHEYIDIKNNPVFSEMIGNRNLIYDNGDVRIYE